MTGVWLPRRALPKREAERWVDDHNPFIAGSPEAQMFEQYFWLSQAQRRERRSWSRWLAAVWMGLAIVAGVLRWFAPEGDGLLTLLYLFGFLAVGQLWWDALADRHRAEADR